MLLVYSGEEGGVGMTQALVDELYGGTNFWDCVFGFQVQYENADLLSRRGLGLIQGPTKFLSFS